MKLVNLVLNSCISLLLLPLMQEVSNLCQLKWSSGLELSVIAMFSVHPVHVEAVLSIVGRADLLYSLLYILAAVLYFKYNPVQPGYTVLKYSAIFLLTGLSLLCKEQGILFLVFLAAVEILKMFGRQKLVKTGVYLVIYCLLCTLLLGYWRLSVCRSVLQKPPK